MTRPWDTTYTLDHEAEDLAASGRTDIHELKIRVRKALELWIEDTSGNVFGSGSDTDNLRLLRALVDDTTIKWTGNIVGVPDGGIGTSQITTIGANNLGDGATFESVQTRYLMINPHRGWFENDSILGEDYIRWHNIPAGVITILPADLPDGVTVTELFVRAQDDGGDGLKVELIRYNLDGTGSDVMASCDIPDSLGYQDVTDNTISNAVVDNSTYRYSLVVSCTSTTSSSFTNMRYAKITFTAEKPLF